MTVVIAPTGTANTASIISALKRAGADSTIASGPNELDGADQVVLPGVGSFGSAMSNIDTSGMRGVLGRPTRRRPTDIGRMRRLSTPLPCQRGEPKPVRSGSYRRYGDPFQR